jgi:hypothetical protein
MKIALSANPISLRVAAASLMAVSASCIIAFLLAVIGWPLVRYIQHIAN